MLKSSKMDTLWILMDTFQKYPLIAAYRKWIVWILSLYIGILKNNNNKENYPPSLLGKKYPKLPPHSEKVSILAKKSIQSIQRIAVFCSKNEKYPFITDSLIKPLCREQQALTKLFKVRYGKLYKDASLSKGGN